MNFCLGEEEAGGGGGGRGKEREMERADTTSGSTFQASLSGTLPPGGRMS